LAKKDPGKFNFGSGGRFAAASGRRGASRRNRDSLDAHSIQGAGPAIIASIRNEVQVATPSLPAALPQVQAGKLRALAVMSPKRLAVLPDVPTVAELGFRKRRARLGRTARARRYAAGDLSAIEAATTKALQSPELRERLAAQGADVSQKSAPPTANSSRTRSHAGSRL